MRAMVDLVNDVLNTAASRSYPLVISFREVLSSWTCLRRAATSSSSEVSRAMFDSLSSGQFRDCFRGSMRLRFRCPYRVQSF